MRLRTFGHGHNNEGHGDDENLNECDAPLTRRPLRIVCSELNEEAYHEGNKQDEACSASEFSDELREVVQFELKRRVLRIATESYGGKK